VEYTPIYSTPAVLLGMRCALHDDAGVLEEMRIVLKVFLHKLTCISHVLVSASLSPYTELARRKTVTAADVGGCLRP
jgi:histone H3/H4